MASGEPWDSEKMLDLYIYDYMVKNNMHNAAEVFAKEANVGKNPVAINAPCGFLTEWWIIFWEIYSSRLLTHPESSHKPQMIMENDGQQNICHTLSRPDMYQQGGRQFPIAISTAFDKILAQSPICSLASKIYEEGHLRLPAKDLIPNLRHLDVNELTPLKPSSSHHSSHFQQQIPPKAQLWTARDKSYGVDLGRTSPMDTILYGVPEDTLTRAGHHGAGLFYKNASLLEALVVSVEMAMTSVRMVKALFILMGLGC
ncbi:hypothetical protein U1Q18_010662 [Sarracenia purpurea var. burkii]